MIYERIKEKTSQQETKKTWNIVCFLREQYLSTYNKVVIKEQEWNEEAFQEKMFQIKSKFYHHGVPVKELVNIYFRKKEIFQEKGLKTEKNSQQRNW